MKVMVAVILAVTCINAKSGYGMDCLYGLKTEDTSRPIILPAHWLDFTAAQEETSVLLKWSTLDEQGIKRFIIERSTAGNDFLEIGTAAAIGNSSKLQNYEFEDVEPITGNSYYRVSCEDENGFMTITLIRKVNFKNRKSTPPVELKNIYVTGKTIHLTPVFHSDDQSIVYLFTRAGRLALTSIVNKYTNTIETSALKGGIYFLSTGYTTSAVIIGD
jgi:hypothetical protein